MTITFALGVGAALGATAALPGEAEAGAAPAEISCTAEDTGEVLSGTIPRDTWEIALTLDDGKGHTHEWTDEEAIMFVDEIDDKVLMLHVAGKPELKFWALPKKMKIERQRRERHGRFGAKAVVEGFADDEAPRRLTLDCTYDYAI